MAHDLRCPHADPVAPPESIRFACACADLAEHAAELQFAALHEEGLA